MAFPDLDDPPKCLVSRILKQKSLNHLRRQLSRSLFIVILEGSPIFRSHMRFKDRDHHIDSLTDKFKAAWVGLLRYIAISSAHMQTELQYVPARYGPGIRVGEGTARRHP